LPPGYEGGKSYPMIVWLYSGSFMSREVYRFGLESSILASLNLQTLASHGYVVLVADAPLKTGTPVLDLMKAVMPAVDRVVDMGIADSGRLGVMGHSYGGYATTSLIEQTWRFRAAIAYAGIYDLISKYGQFYVGRGGGGWAETEGQGAIGGTPWQFRDRWIENSPIFYLDRVRTPLLLVHGDLDPIPYQQSEEVFVGLRRLGKEVVYAKYAGEGHVLKSPANVIDFWNRVIAWFDDHLKK
jgi:dipeptidyl aminopeptidase/acylaminoacyl peptidase